MILPDGSFLRPNPRHLGQLQKLNTCRRNRSGPTGTRPPCREGCGAAAARVSRSRCESRRFSRGLRRQHARCAASGLQRTGRRVQAAPQLCLRLGIHNFPALCGAGGKAPRTALRMWRAAPRPALPLLLPATLTSPGRGDPCHGIPREQPTHPSAPSDNPGASGQGGPELPSYLQDTESSTLVAGMLELSTLKSPTDAMFGNPPLLPGFCCPAGFSSPNMGQRREGRRARSRRRGRGRGGAKRPLHGATPPPVVRSPGPTPPAGARAGR